ncbi:unnamed protein product [Ascophyllum nodosum]
MWEYHQSSLNQKPHDADRSSAISDGGLEAHSASQSTSDVERQLYYNQGRPTPAGNAPSASTAAFVSATAVPSTTTVGASPTEGQRKNRGAKAIIGWRSKATAAWCSQYILRSIWLSSITPKIEGGLRGKVHAEQRDLPGAPSERASKGEAVGQDQTQQQKRRGEPRDGTTSPVEEIRGALKRGATAPQPSLASASVPPLAPWREKGQAPGRQGPGASATPSMYTTGGPCRMVGEYQILETLGEGLTSKVKKARHVRNGHVVALKVMFQLRDDRRRDVRCKRLNEEIQAMDRCNGHSNTVNLLEVLGNAPYPKRDGTIEMVNVLVLEFCAYGELFRLLGLGQNTQPLPSYVVREYFHQLMDGLAYCHDLGISHRDLKPQNLLVDSEFNLKIADFGFAATGRPHMFCSSIVGTPAYTAPEVLGDATWYSGPQADIWSAGVVLFMMVVGHLPMERAECSDWWFRALKMGRTDLFWQSHENKLSFSLPTDAKLLITAMLNPEPSRRITVNHIMAHPYLCGAQLPRESRQAQIRSEMSIRYQMTRAFNHSAIVNTTTTAGSAPSSGEVRGVEASAVVAASAGAIAQPRVDRSRQHNGDMFNRDTRRSSRDDDNVGPPEITAEAAGTITGGFVARGWPRDVIKALERVLHDMGAQIAGVQRDGARTFRTYFKVSAVIPLDPNNSKTGGGVGIVANLYRVSGEVPKEKGGLDGAGVPNLLVVLRRKKGDYFRYGIVEKRVIDRMTKRTTSATTTDSTTAIVEGKEGVEGGKQDSHHISESSSPSGGGGGLKRFGRGRLSNRLVQ